MNSLILNNPHIHQFIADQIKASANDARWDRFIEASTGPERRYRAKMREVFTQQLDEIMSNLNMFKSQKAIDDWLIDWEKYVLLLNEFGQLELPGILSAWADMELEALEVGISFDVLDPKVQTAIEHRANHFADSVVNETRDRLHRVISDSIGQGDSVPILEGKIRDLYSRMSKFRATRIARSETIWAQNEGAEWSYIQSGVVQAKQWWTARDERRCPFCAEMHGKILGLEQNYFNLGESLTVPKPETPKSFDIQVKTTHGQWVYKVLTNFKASDTLTYTFSYEDISHPPLHPFCRCVLLPVVELTRAYVRYLAYKWGK